MTTAFTEEWANLQSKLLDEPDFMGKLGDFNSSVTIRFTPSPEHGVTEEYVYGIDYPSLKCFYGQANAWETDFVFEADYEAWYRINEGLDGLVDALMDQKFLVTKGSVSYLARFVPAMERYFALSRQQTTGYHGEFAPAEDRPSP